MFADVLKRSGILYFVIQQTIVPVYFPVPLEIEVITSLQTPNLEKLPGIKNHKVKYSYPIYEKLLDEEVFDNADNTAGDRIDDTVKTNTCDSCSYPSISHLSTLEPVDENKSAYEKPKSVLSSLPTADLVLPTPVIVVEPPVDPFGSVNPGCGCGMVSEKGMETICLCLE